MAKPTPRAQTGVPPRRKGGTTAPGRPVPPKKRPPRRRGGRPRRVTVGIPLAVVVIVVVVAAIVLLGGGGPKQSAVGYSVNGAKVYGALGPEGIPLEVGPPLAAANTGLTGRPIDAVQCGSTEVTTVHYHVHLAIFVDGQPRSVPLGVGMVPPALVQQTKAGPFAQGSNKCLYWLHVHAADGIIHVEAPASNFVLGQFFGVWGQPLSTSQVGPAKGPVHATVNGKPYDGDPIEIPMRSHEQIVLNVGAPVVTPPPISFAGSGL